MNDLSVKIAGVTLKNPVVTASGTFGFGREYAEFYDLALLGGVTTTGVSYEPWNGNPPPRVAETYGGMLNAVGLQNCGVEDFIANELPFLRKYNTACIVNICGRTIYDYVAVAERLSCADIDLIELNISCPNIKEGGMAFGQDSKSAATVTREVKRVSKHPLIVKLSPNVTDITEIAKSCEASGADALSLINTLLGMKIDIYTRKPLLGNTLGGLSGPCVKPIAVRMVYQVRRAVSVPIIGMGGIVTGDDAVEFLLAGANAVAVGTANFTNPLAALEVIDGIEKYVSIYGGI